jgi:hypothetical protein
MLRERLEAFDFKVLMRSSPFFSALAEAQVHAWLQNNGTKTQPLTILFALYLYNL